jgi:uncharacterized protein YcbK (DUF882 family)
MSKGLIAVLSVVVATAVPAAANAGNYRHHNLKNRAMTSRHIAKVSGTSVTCLTWEARALLNRIRARYGTVDIVSTCRPGAKIAGTKYPSRHASGQAIDFRVPGKKGEVVRWLIATHHNGGVMTYSDMDHIHVDIGPHFVALNRPSGRT